MVINENITIPLNILNLPPCRQDQMIINENIMVPLGLMDKRHRTNKGHIKSTRGNSCTSRQVHIITKSDFRFGLNMKNH
jgi:hypothetical protein